MWSQLSPGLRINLFFTLLLGVVYTLAVTGICQVAFPHQANGSLITVDGEVVGPDLIGQRFRQPEYIHPRPSATGAYGYDAAASSGSNLGPTRRRLYDRVKASVDEFRRENPDFHGPIPADLLTASASGLDPHISPAAAAAQAARVARARGIEVVRVNELIAQFTVEPEFGLLGEPRVRVLRLNLALDQLSRARR